MYKMNPPQELRAVCEEVMLVSRNRQSPSLVVESLQSLGEFLASSDCILDPYVEFVLLPLFFIHPSDAEQAAEIPERVREEVLRCIRLVVENSRTLFERRGDLFFPALLRALATLTDTEQEGRAFLGLKDETKSEAIHLLKALIETQSSFKNVENTLVFHCAALLLDLSGKDRSREVRIYSLSALLALINRATPEHLEFMFPGASSSLCETSRADYKLGPIVQELATEALRILVVRVLNDDRILEDALKVETMITLKDVLVQKSSAVDGSPPQEGETLPENQFIYFDKLFPLLLRILREDIGGQVAVPVRLARIKLASELLQHCRAVVRKTDHAYSILIRTVISGCADFDETVIRSSEEEILKLRTALGESGQIELNAHFERLLLDCLLSLSQPADAEDETIVAIRLGMCTYLCRELNAKRVRAVLDASQSKVIWSLLVLLRCDSTRFEQKGLIEYARVSRKETMSRLNMMLDTIATSSRQTSDTLSMVLLDAIETVFADNSPEAGRREEDDEIEGYALNLPRSYLPQAIFLAQTFSGDVACNRIVEVEPLWTLSTRPVPSRVMPLEAGINALTRAAALEAIGRSAKQNGQAFRLRLVDTLFPVLQCMGDDNPGVRIAAEATLHEVTLACGYFSESSLLQANVDYMVDAIIRRLPLLSRDDLRFADVIEALIRRIPVWVPGEETSPWIEDLVQTILDGLDDRAGSPQVIWSLLRIAEVVSKRASDVTLPSGYITDHVQTANFEVEDGNELQDERVDAAIRELTEWLNPGPRMNTEIVVNDAESVTDDEEDPNRNPISRENDQVFTYVESILLKSAIFIADEDVLVRQQASRVAINCILLLGNQTPDKARKAIHQIWQFIVEQLREERNPHILMLLLDCLSVAAATEIGADFFSRRFSEEAWPVMETVLERATHMQRSPHGRKNASVRDAQLAKQVLKCLQSLGKMLVPRAERIAMVTAKFICLETSGGETKELKRLAGEVWVTLARHAGDVLWLPVAVAMDLVSKEQLDSRKLRLTCGDPTVAKQVWHILQDQ